MSVYICGRVWDGLNAEVLRRKAAWNLVFEEMIDTGWAEEVEGMSNLLSSLIFKVSHRKDIHVIIGISSPAVGIFLNSDLHKTIDR